MDEVNSLVNARSTRGEGDTLIVKELLKDWPEQDIDLGKLKQYVLNNPVYLNDYISEDGRVAAIIIKPLASVKDSEAMIGGKHAEDKDLISDFEDETLAEDLTKETPTEKSASFHVSPESSG